MEKSGSELWEVLPELVATCSLFKAGGVDEVAPGV